MKITKKRLRKMIQESMAAMGRGAPIPMQSRATPEFARQVKGTQIKEYSEYASYADVADSMDDITDMLEGVVEKYADSGWLDQGDHASLSADLMRLFENATRLRGAFDGLAQSMGDRK